MHRTYPHRKQKSAFTPSDFLSKTFNHSSDLSFDPELSFGLPKDLPPSHSRTPKWLNPIPLYKNYRGKYPNALFKQKDTQLSILSNALQSLLTKMSQLAARFATVFDMQPENVTFFASLTCKSQSLLVKSFESTHHALCQLLSRLLQFLHIHDASSLKIRTLRLLTSSHLPTSSPLSQVYESQISLLKPTVGRIQVFALRGLAKEYDKEARMKAECFIGWEQATEFIKLVDEARFLITMLEELHQTYQSTYLKEHPETRFLLGNTMSNVFATRNSAAEATKKDRLKYLRKLVRRTKESTSLSFQQFEKVKKTHSSESLLEKQRLRAEKAMISGVQKSKNQALTSSVRMLLYSKAGW